MEKCIVCKQDVKPHEAIKTTHGVVHAGVCQSFYEEKSRDTNLSESDISKDLESVQIL